MASLNAGHLTQTWPYRASVSKRCLHAALTRVISVVRFRLAFQCQLTREHINQTVLQAEAGHTHVPQHVLHPASNLAPTMHLHALAGSFQGSSVISRCRHLTKVLTFSPCLS